MNVSELQLKMISLFIGPTVFATLITGIFSLVLSRRSERMKNITAERSKWREKIRDILERIQSDNTDMLKAALNALKLCINAYGLEDSVEARRFDAKYILMDTHVWALIYQIENAISKNKSVDAECELLRKYISLLLKYDWERAKREVNHSISSVFGWSSMTIGMMGTFLLPLVSNYNVHMMNAVYYASISVLSGLVVIVIGIILDEHKKNKLREMAASEYNGFRNIGGKVVDVYRKMRPYVNYSYYSYTGQSVILRCLLLVIFNYFLIMLQAKWGIEGDEISILIIECYILYFIGAIVVAIENKKIITNDYNYLLEINRALSKFYEL